MTINIPRLNSFCGISLKTSCIIAGGFQLFFSSLYLANISIMNVVYSRRNSTEYYEIPANVLLMHSIFIEVLFSFLLLYGAIKEKTSFLVSWLLYAITLILDILWTIIFQSVQYFILHFFLEDVIVTGIMLVFVMIVYSYYKQLSQSEYPL